MLQSRPTAGTRRRGHRTVPAREGHGRERKPQPSPRPYAYRRKLHMASGVWSWEMRKHRLMVRDPSGHRAWRVSIIDYLNDDAAASGDSGRVQKWTWDLWERALWKGWGCRERCVTPSGVKGYIERRLLPDLEAAA